MFDQPLLLGGILRQRHEAIADQIGRGLVAGIEQEDAVVQQLLLGQPLAILLALDQPRQHVLCGIAGLGAPPRHQRFEIGEKIAHRLVAARGDLRPHHRLQRAQNGERPVAQRFALVVGHVEQIADHLDGNGGSEILDQLDPCALAAMRSSSMSTRRDQIALHRRDRARRQRAHDQPPHAGVRGRIVEDEARGVVFVERRVAVFRRKLLFLVGGEFPGVLVGGDEVVIAGQEPGAAAQPLDRFVFPQRTIGRVGVGIEFAASTARGRNCQPALAACTFMPWVRT